MPTRVCWLERKRFPYCTSLQQDTETMGMSFPEATTSLFAGASHTAGLTSWPRSSLPLPAPAKVIRFASMFVKYSWSVPAIHHAWYLQDTTQMPNSYLHHAATIQSLGTRNNPGAGTHHHSDLKGSPLHLLLQHHHPAPTFRMLNPTSLPCCMSFIHNAECYTDLQPAPAKGQDMQMLLPTSEDPTRLR